MHPPMRLPREKEERLREGVKSSDVEYITPHQPALINPGFITPRVGAAASISFVAVAR